MSVRIKNRELDTYNDDVIIFHVIRDWIRDLVYGTRSYKAQNYHGSSKIGLSDSEFDWTLVSIGQFR